jgi:hypothetical protein
VPFSQRNAEAVIGIVGDDAPTMQSATSLLGRNHRRRLLIARAAQRGAKSTASSIADKRTCCFCVPVAAARIPDTPVCKMAARELSRARLARFHKL